MAVGCEFMETVILTSFTEPTGHVHPLKAGHSKNTTGTTVRRARPGEEFQLWEIFQSSVHGLARQHYSPRQLAAWAPPTYPGAAWSERILHNHPFVAEQNGEVLAYADVQPDGYIDQFFVAESAAGRGIGSALMLALLQEAERLGASSLHTKASLTAQPFFHRFGFVVDAEQEVLVRGVALRNARMSRDLTLMA